MEQLLIARQLMELYCFNSAEYHWIRPGMSEYVYSDRELTLGDVFAHLDGEKTVCVFARERNTTFMCFDVDEPNKDGVRALIARIAGLGVPRERIYVSLSGGKGYHVELFFDAKVWKSVAENFFKHVTANLDMRVEFRPMRHKSIKMPLGIHQKTGQRCWYCDRDTLEPIEDFDYIFKIERVSAEEFQQIVFELNKKKRAEDIALAKTRKYVAPEKPKSYIPDDYRKEPRITAPGQRHDMMLRKAVWLRSVGGDEQAVFDGLMRWVSRQNPEYISSGETEIEKDAMKIAIDVCRKYEINYHRKNQDRKMPDADITGRDMQIVLGIRRRNARKVAMLICCYCKVFDTCTMSLERIAQIIGFTYPTASSAVKELLNEKVIKVHKKGGLTYVNGEPYLIATSYTMSEDAKPDASVRSEQRMRFSLQEISTDFDGFYYDVLTKMCGIRELKKRLTDSEIRRCEEICDRESQDGNG